MYQASRGFTSLLNNNAFYGNGAADFDTGRIRKTEMGEGKAATEARHSSMPGLQDTHDARVSARGRHARAAVKSEAHGE